MNSIKQLNPVKKNGSVDDDNAPKATRAVWAQYAKCSGHFYTLRVFTKEPIREQEIKLECMNYLQPTQADYYNM